MDKLDIILWIAVSGFGLMIIMWYCLNQKIARMIQRIDKPENGFNHRIDKLDEKTTNIDRNLCRLEGAFTSKRCRMINDDRSMKKAE